MEIRIKEPLYIVQQGKEYIVRPGTVGVEKNKVVFFYDVTRTSAVGYPREYCLENPQTFQVSRNLTDREVSIRDVSRLIENSSHITPNIAKILLNEINSL